MESGDSEYEEEEVVVLAELNGLVDDELLRKGCTFQFVGIDTDKPVLQLGKYNFLGSYEDQIGSALFLKQSTDEEGRKTWSKQCFSDKKLSMQRVFLRKKGEELPVRSEAAGDDVTAMEEDLAETPEAAEGQGEGNDQEPETDPLAIGNEEQPEESTTKTTSEAADSGDVDMAPAEGSETMSSKPTSSANNPPTESGS